MVNMARVDLDTGEIKTEPPFVKAYIGHLAQVKGLPPLQTDVLYFLLSNMNYDNRVAITRKSKLRFISDHNTSSQTFSNCISKLAKVGFIDIEDSSQYFVNPDYFTKSDWTKTKRLVAKWIFSDEGESFEHDIIDETGEVIVEAEEPEADQVLEKDNSSVKTKSTRAVPPQAPEYVDFDDFWLHYPKKVGKAPAIKVWQKMKVDEELFFSIKAHLMTAYKLTDKKYVPNPSTYLTQERWNDEVIEQSDGGLKNENCNKSLRSRIERGMQFEG